MKTNMTAAREALRLTVPAALLLAGFMVARANPQVESRIVVTSADPSSTTEELLIRGTTAPGSKRFTIQSLEPNQGAEPPREVAWLGVSTEEVTEVLSAQLGFKSGEGLVVVFVAPDSPAARAGIEKHDVLVELGDQLLVHPEQLRKMIRARKEGDTVQLGFYRHGKKQTASATLGKTTERAGLWLEKPAFDEKLQLVLGNALGEGLRERMESVQGALARVGANRQKIEIEVQRSLEQAQKALQEALRHKTPGAGLHAPGAKELEALAQSRVEVGKGATVVVKRDSNSVKSLVQTDDTGTFVIVANPRKRLTVHDADGKLVFDGEIETAEQQGQVPAELWQRVKPMIEQLGPVEKEAPEPQAQSSHEKKT
jgi:hypothetical protein